MTKVILENAVVTTAIKKAESVAPSARGVAFDQAHGVVLYVQPDDSDFPLVLRATNLLIRYSEWLTAVECEGEPAVWRLPAPLAGAILGKLPVGTGKTVTIEQVGHKVEITSGRMRASLNLLESESFPTWEPFSGDGMTFVEALGEKLRRVEFCATKDATRVTSGVHLDGEYAAATDKSRVARVPCRLDLGEGGQPITFPAGVLEGVLPPNAPVRVGTDGTTIQLMPDDWTQIEAATLGNEFPDVGGIASTAYTHSVRLHREELLDLISRVSAVDQGNRMPIIQVFLGQEELTLYVDNGTDSLGDLIEVPGQCDHKRVKRLIAPSYLVDAVRNCPKDTVEIHYNLGPARDKEARILLVTDGEEYYCWISLIARQKDGVT